MPSAMTAARAHNRRSPTREDRPTDWMLYEGCHLAECFFNKLKRFRKIALRCEKTAGSFKAFVDLASAMASIG